MSTATKTAPAKSAPRKTAAKAAPAKTPPKDELAVYAVQMIALADIDVSHNPRTFMDEEATVELADSITEHGLLSPIAVEDTGGEPAYRLVFGGRRVAAFQQLGREFIPATVRPAGEPARTAAARLVENLHRAELSPMDEARALQELITEHGLKQVEVATLIGRNQGYVSKRLALLKLIERGHTLLVSGQLPLEHAVDVAKLPVMVQAGVLNNIANGQHPGTAVRHARDQVAKLRERADVIKRLQKAGTPVIDRAVDKGIIPEDARMFRGSDAEWEADPNRLAVVRTSDHSWGHGIERWVDRYTTTPEADRDEQLANTRVPRDGEQLAGFTASSPATADEEFAAYRTQLEDQRQAAAAAEEARTRRLAELRDFVRTLINGKISPTWERFLIRLSLITAVVGDPDAEEGCPAAVSSAGEALELPANADFDLGGYETMTAVLGLLDSDDAPGTLLRLALGARLLNGLRFLERYETQQLVGAEVLAFLRGEGLELTEQERELADSRTNRLDGLAVMYELVQDLPDADEPDEPPVIDAELPEPGDKEPVDDDDPAEEQADEATGEPEDDFDAPVETFRPDHAAEATRPTRAEIEGMKRPQLIDLAGKHQLETTPRMTRLQLVALCTKALVDPAADIA